MGDYRLTLPIPSATPDCLTGGVPAKVRVYDHILELPTIDDFLNHPGDMYADIRQQLNDPDLENVSASRQICLMNLPNQIWSAKYDDSE